MIGSSHFPGLNRFANTEGLSHPKLIYSVINF